MTKSNLSKIDRLGWWIDTTTVLLFLAMSRSSSMVLSALRESSPEHGSSRRRKLGFVSSSRAIITRLRSPVDRLWLLVVMAVCLHFSRPSSLMSRLILRIFWASLHFSRKAAAYPSSCMAVNP
mmetsp:Transcript_10251/g.18698  ORF Transcript_10251/g.18698 Transcript_10251/m.18698 type:complete len:123 (-) Transcript_10251:55-423(-)